LCEGEMQEASRDGHLCRLTIGTRAPVILR
jgi:hypothetical protein